MAGQSKTRSTAKPPAINAAKLPAHIDIASILADGLGPGNVF